MPSLKLLKNRIQSVKSTQKITKAMQLISVSRLHRAREALFASLPYQEAIKRLLAITVMGVGHNLWMEDPLIYNTNDSRHLLVVVTSDRGLCGAFNANIIKRAKTLLQNLLLQKKKVSAIFIGKKGYELLREYYKFEHVDLFNHAKHTSFLHALKIAGEILDWFAAGKFDTCSLIYNEFVSMIKQEVQQDQLIPIVSSEQAAVPVDASVYNYYYEPALEELQDLIVKRCIATQIYHALLENAASEHSARMLAMDNATRNSQEILKKLSNQYNRTRQANITKELTEIISGASAV